VRGWDDFERAMIVVEVAIDDGRRVRFEWTLEELCRDPAMDAEREALMALFRWGAR
jgi:hypothetical protein